MTPNLPTTDTRTPQQWFDEVFWIYYPRRENPRGARSRFIDIVTGKYKKLPKTNARDICVAAFIFSELEAKRGTELRFIPLATTWLNQARWESIKHYKFELAQLKSKPRSTREITLAEKLSDVSWAFDDKELEAYNQQRSSNGRLINI